MEISIEKIDELCAWIDSISVKKYSMKEKLQILEYVIKLMEQCENEYRGKEMSKEVRKAIMAEFVHTHDPTPDGQEVKGEWYAPKWGCDTLDHILDNIAALPERNSEIERLRATLREMLAVAECSLDTLVRYFPRDPGRAQSEPIIRASISKVRAALSAGGSGVNPIPNYGDSGVITDGHAFKALPAASGKMKCELCEDWDNATLTCARNNVLGGSIPNGEYCSFDKPHFVSAVSEPIPDTGKMVEGEDGHEPGELVAKGDCPCCGSHLDIVYGDDEGELSVVGIDDNGIPRETFWDESQANHAEEGKL